MESIASVVQNYTNKSAAIRFARSLNQSSSQPYAHQASSRPHAQLHNDDLKMLRFSDILRPIVRKFGLSRDAVPNYILSKYDRSVKNDVKLHPYLKVRQDIRSKAYAKIPNLSRFKCNPLRGMSVGELNDILKKSNGDLRHFDSTLEKGMFQKIYDSNSSSNLNDRLNSTQQRTHEAYTEAQLRWFIYLNAYKRDSELLTHETAKHGYTNVKIPPAVNVPQNVVPALKSTSVTSSGTTLANFAIQTSKTARVIGDQHPSVRFNSIENIFAKDLERKEEKEKEKEVKNAAQEALRANLHLMDVALQQAEIAKTQKKRVEKIEEHVIQATRETTEIMNATARALAENLKKMEQNEQATEQQVAVNKAVNAAQQAIGVNSNPFAGFFADVNQPGYAPQKPNGPAL